MILINVPNGYEVYCRPQDRNGQQLKTGVRELKELIAMLC